jgi:tetratricopeptide (TPR) repeat protein
MCALLATTMTLAAPCSSRAEDVEPPNMEAAREHFQNARSLYSQGAYRDAIRELEAAHTFDPTAKDLVFNLGIVNEKLADIDRALYWFHTYETLSLTPQERERADSVIRRLEGAKHEVLAIPPSPPPAPPRAIVVAPTAHAAPRVYQPPHGRIDAFTIGAAGLSAAALTVGVVMSVSALSDRVTSDFVTRSKSQGGPTYLDAQSQEHAAHAEAVVADIAFGTALASALAATYLYISRTRTTPGRAGGSPVLVAAPLFGGGAVTLRGAF